MMIREIVQQFAERRVREIDAEFWRMIGDGCLFSEGWGLAIVDDYSNPRMFSFHLHRLPPGCNTIPVSVLPDGAKAIQIIKW